MGLRLQPGVSSLPTSEKHLSGYSGSNFLRHEPAVVCYGALQNLCRAIRLLAPDVT